MNDRKDRNDPEEPFEFIRNLWEQFGIDPEKADAAAIQQMVARLQAAFAQMGSPSADLDWIRVAARARQTSEEIRPDPKPGATDRQAVADAVRLADHWLDQLLTMPGIDHEGLVWSRTDWINQTFPVWKQLVRPIADGLTEAASRLVSEAAETEENPELAAMSGIMQPMIRTSVATLLSDQIGRALGQLAGSVLTVSDMGLPLTDKPRVAVVPSSVAAFAEGLDQSPSDVLLYLVVRESARQRLFASATWLGPQLLALVEHYAREISLDIEAIRSGLESSLGGATSMDDLARASQDLQLSLFQSTVSSEQAGVLERLETLLALVEGWVDDVTGQIVHTWMPHTVRLGEMIRRRRASNAQANQALRQLVGLELRPRRLRESATLWAAVRSIRGGLACETAWDHPDLMPTSTDLDDPLEYAEHGHQSATDDEFDRELVKLLDQDSDQPPPS